MLTISRAGRRRMLRYYRAILIPLMIVVFALVVVLSGCAALDDAAVARTDRLKEAPFYKSYRKSTVTPEPALLLPLHASPASAARLEPLRAAIDQYLQSQTCCIAFNDEMPAGSPAVYVGSSEGENVPIDGLIIREEFEKYPPMIVHYAKPSPAWRSAIAVQASELGAGRVLVTQLDLVQYPKADKGFFGKKVVLGTHHESKVRFLSAIDKPIEVLQLSGAVLSADGTELCAGAEGIIGSDSPFWVQVLEAGKDIDDATLEQVLHNERRDDVPGAPLNWQVAADQLLWNLLRRCS